MDKILLINDKDIYNQRYRSCLMKYLRDKKIEVLSLGVFDNPIKFVLVVLKNYFNSIFFSSNLKANLILLLILKSKKVILFNGLGRYRKARYFRLLIIFLIRLNQKQTIIFQNYADYRYFSRYSAASVYWVPGSGGVVRKVGYENNLIIVSRDSKLETVSKSILAFDDATKNSYEFVIVGCNDLVTDKFLGDLNKVNSIGYKLQSDIFKNGSLFFQPSGYGEGVPHTLVDALVSGMEVIINKKDFIRYGLYKIEFSYAPVTGSWIRILPNQAGKFNLEVTAVNEKYFRLINKVK